jgi:hypothetical protein
MYNKTSDALTEQNTQMSGEPYETLRTTVPLCQSNQHENVCSGNYNINYNLLDEGAGYK